MSGKAKITFSLPDTLTDYRIITVANTRDSHFAVAEKTIEVRKDYVIEAHAPMILRPSDTSVITASVFNATKKITGTTLVLSIGTGTSQIKKTVDLTLNPGASLSRDFSFSVLPEWSGNIPYRLDLFEKTTILDSLS